MRNSTPVRTTSIQQVRINLRPAKDDLINNPLYYPIDLLIAQNGFANENIMKQRANAVLFWDWTIITVNNLQIPVPIHTSTKTTCTLYNWNDIPVNLSYNECACVTAIYYLDMLMRLADKWDSISKEFPPITKLNMETGISWMEQLSPQQYREIVYALKAQLSDKGHYVLN